MSDKNIHKTYPSIGESNCNSLCLPYMLFPSINTFGQDTLHSPCHTECTGNMITKDQVSWKIITCHEFAVRSFLTGKKLRIFENIPTLIR